MPETYPLQLDTNTQEILGRAAAEVGLSESDVAIVAINLLVHYLDEIRDAAAVCLYPSNPDESPVPLWAVTVPKNFETGLLASLVEFQTYELGSRGSGTSQERHLRSVD